MKLIIEQGRTTQFEVQVVEGCVWASSPLEAQTIVEYNEFRESPGKAILAVQFSKEEGFSIK